MPKVSTPDKRLGNRLLAMLNDEDYQQVIAKMRWEKLEIKKVLYESNVPIKHIYFPLNGVVSLVMILEDGSIIEVATIGKEGMVGLPVFLGTDAIPGQAFAQVAGEAMVMKTEDFKRVIKNGSSLQVVLHRYTQALFNQIAQSAACNRAHGIEQRCARWLLMTHDRVGSDNFYLTHEFLAQMLGVHRPNITLVAGILQKAGFINYVRGKITIVDREGLEQTSCNCYHVIKAEYDRLLGW